ncbi:MAG: 50S ribosomal protein L23 [Planctomycetia bacterium]|nr:50S ribosomal protein L23 [Planctomycetia bacterium]
MKTERLGPELPSQQVIIRPLVTEKGQHYADKNNAYAFEVNSRATKWDVRRAVEELFNVKVVRVNILIRKGKPRRTRQGYVLTRDWKKAIVTRDPEHRINFF